MKSLQEAAGVYCEQREAIAALNQKLLDLGKCETQEEEERDAEGRVTYPGYPSCVDRLPYREPEGGPQWWEATEQQMTEHYCGVCRAKVPLWKERRAMKRRLAGLMHSMRGAYRRETRLRAGVR